MIGLFQELGPCRISNDSTGVDLNPTSWNEYANVYVYIKPNFAWES
jgi:carboxypeptidase C (cathepsin A)